MISLILSIMVLIVGYILYSRVTEKVFAPDDRKTLVWPYMFITVACGAVSGFHATQSPMVAKCIRTEKRRKKSILRSDDYSLGSYCLFIKNG